LEGLGDGLFVLFPAPALRVTQQKVAGNRDEKEG
jgi:hypothetical protein